MIKNYNADKFSSDLKAGITVFLVAVPLCLGIALASGVPATSGLIAGVIGGLIVGFLSNSQLSVSGCATGLVPMVLLATADLGSVELLFVAVFISGIIQYLLGLANAGVMSHYIPFAVIKGMLAAIGLILIINQVPYLMGYSQAFETSEGSMGFSHSDRDAINTYDRILLVFHNFSIAAVLISSICLFILIICSKDSVKSSRYFKPILNYVPASLLVIIAAIFVNHLISTLMPDIALKNEQLVNMPTLNELSGLPIISRLNIDWFNNWLVYKYALLIALVGSIETLLCIEASDKLDPEKRHTSTRVELKAQGVGNFLSGLLGGLPITSVIVRTSVNIENGARTKISTILHGVFLLLSLLFLTPLMNQIPLAALASILVLTGYKLIHEKLIIDMFRKGANQFIPFIATIIFILVSDLLTGVLLGAVVSIFFILRNYYNVQNIKIINEPDDKTVTIKFSEYTTFLSKANIRKVLSDIPNNTHLYLDLSNCILVDYEIDEILSDYIANVQYKNIVVEIIPSPATE